MTTSYILSCFCFSFMSRNYFFYTCDVSSSKTTDFYDVNLTILTSIFTRFCLFFFLSPQLKAKRKKNIERWSKSSITSFYSYPKLIACFFPFEFGSGLSWNFYQISSKNKKNLETYLIGQKLQEHYWISTFLASYLTFISHCIDFFL
jgi:hypothetical protein